MRQFVAEEIRQLLAEHPAPCISLYQPTNRRFPDNDQDPIRYRNLLKVARESLEQKYPKREVSDLLDKFAPLENDGDFWNYQLDGLGVFCARDLFRVIKLQRPVRDFVIVADTFHIRPLVRILQSADRYQVLCVSQRNVSLYEGNRYTLDPVRLSDRVPRTIVEALGEELTQPHLTVAAYGGVGGAARFHGHHDSRDEAKIDLERYLRVIDRAIWENHSRQAHLPLILAAQAHYHPVFHAVTQNSHLVKEGIEWNPDFQPVEELRERAWQAVQPQYEQRIDHEVQRYHVASAQNKGSADPVQLAEAATFGRIASLLIDEEQRIGGRIDRETGKVEFGPVGVAGFDDLLDDLAELTLRADGQVLVVPKANMPTGSGAAAVFRF